MSGNRGLLDRIKAGVKAWMPVAHGFSALAVVLTLASGGEVLRKYGPRVTLPLVIVVYYVAFAAAGAVFGALAPFKRTRLGAALVGFAAMLPMGFMVVPLIATETTPRWVVLISSLGVALVLGPGYGLIDRAFDEDREGV
jgi:hypothetical protein